MMPKKILSIFLTIMLLCSFSNVKILAEQSLCDKVGIGVLSSHSVIKLDGKEGTSRQTTMPNTQIINLGNSIGVFSSPTDSAMRINGYSLISAILNSSVYPIKTSQAITANGYSLEYITPSGIADSSEIVENGGFVRAAKNSEIINIPIVDIYHLKSYDESQIGKDWQNIPSGTSITRTAAGLAGKTADDKAFQITVNPETTVSPSNPCRADIRNINTLNTPKTVVTIEFEMRVTGDAAALVERNGGYSLLRLKADGTMSFKSYDAGNKMVDVSVCDDASQWHNVAVVYDYAGDRIMYWFDGNMVETKGARTTDDVLSEIRFAVDNTFYQSGGTVAVDNVRVTRGFYKPFGVVEINSSDKRIIADSSRITVFSDPINPEHFISSDEILDALETEEGYSVEYVDNAKTASFCENVTSGYIRITNSFGKQHYIPISVRGLSFASEFGKGCVVHNENGSQASGGFSGDGGKSESDFYFGFRTGENALNGFDGMEYTVPDSSNPYTYVFNMYADGGATAQIDFSDGQNRIPLIQWKPDGTIQYADETAGNKKTALQRGLWHRICITYNAYTSCISLYANGVLITDKALSASPDELHKLFFGTGGTSSNGLTAFDDMDAYTGFWYPQKSSVNISDDADVFIDYDRNILYYDCSVVSTPAELIDAIKGKTDATAIRVYSDYTFTKDTMELCKDSVAVITAGYPERYLYLRPSADYVKINVRNGKISASYNAPEGDRMLFVALYDGIRLSAVTAQTVSSDGVCTAELEYDSDFAYKVFVRKCDMVTPLSCFEGHTDNIHISNRVIMNCDFETSFPLTFHKNGSIIEPTEDLNGNTAVLFKRSGSGDFHLNAMTLNGQSDTMVFEFDLKVIKPSSQVTFMIQDGDSKIAYIGQLLPGGYLKLGNHNEKIDTDKWYKFGAIVNSYERSIEYYLNGQKILTGSLASDFAMDSGVNLLRFHVPSSTWDGDNSVEFMIDNLKIYESGELKEELGDIVPVINLTGKTVFESDDNIKALLDGFCAVHTRSGVAFKNGKKTQLTNKPYEKDGIVYAYASELSDIFGLNITSSGYVSIEEFANMAGLRLTRADSAINSGLYVLGNREFDVPEDSSALKKLNEYMLYVRPDMQTIYDVYAKSPLRGTHPRLQATSDDFDRIRVQSETDTYMKRWKSTVISLADSLVRNNKPVVYELRDGVRLLMVSREVLNNMYVLGMAYQLTGQQKYADRAWTDLRAVCVDFYDWHPGHDIDCAEMCAAVAIGYDWMYHGLSDSMRQTIEKALYEKGLYEAVAAYQTSSAAMSGMAYGGANRNVVCNSGVTMAALAVMDVYPEEASFVVSCALRAVELVLYQFAPDGAYFEGPSYWEYTMQYASKLVSSLDSALGNNFSLESLEGLSVTTDYMLHMQTENGIYCYGDGAETSKIYVPEMLWLSGKYDRKDNASAVMKLTGGSFYGGEDIVLALLWYDTSTMQSDIEMSTYGYFRDEDTFAIRDSWQSGGSYLGVHAGTSHTQLDGGSFIYETDGIRWAIDPGSGDYNQTGYFDSGENGRKWRIFYCRAESHNTLVVNPSELPDHVVGSYAPMTVKDIGDEGAIVVVDTTALHRDAKSAKRGFFFTDNRQSLVVRDEIDVENESDIYWFMQTRADVITDSNGATLSLDGKTLRLDFVSNVPATIEVDKAKPLPASPVEENDRYGDFNRIAIKLHGSGAVDITVKLTPQTDDATGVSDYNKSIDLWSLNTK